MTRLLAIAATAAVLAAGTSAANAETCWVKDQIPVPCGGTVYPAPAPIYGGPVYSAPVYGGPAYNDYYADDYNGAYDDYYGSPYSEPDYGPSVSFGFGGFGFGDGFRHGDHHGSHMRWHHRH